MKPVNYSNMNDQELKQYLLEHKDNKEAFYAYLDRKQQQPKQVLIGVNELDTLTPDQQIELITQRLQEKFHLL
jgi:dienelactone hydrolase